MKNKLLLLSTALFGAVSFGNYANSMDLTQDLSPTQKREVCINRLSEIGEASSILINKKLNTTKEDFDFICQKDPSIVYQGTVLFINHTETLYYSKLISTVELMELNEFVISNIVQTTGTNHEGLARLNKALPIFSKLKNEFSSDNKQSSIFGPLMSQLRSTLEFKPLNDFSQFKRVIESKTPDVTRYSHEINTIEYAIKYNDMNLLKSINSYPGFDIFQNADTPLDNYYNLKNLSFLDFSALHGNVDAFRFFLLNNLSITNKTPECAIIGGNHEIIRLCMQQQNDCFGNDCLEIAVKYHKNDVANWLMEENSNNNNPVSIGLTVEYGNIPMFLKIIQDPSNESFSIDKNCYTLKYIPLLHMSALYDQKEMAEILLIDGLADVNAPLHTSNKRKAIEVAQTDEMRELLRQYGAN